jgi:hypothetical protein
LAATVDNKTANHTQHTNCQMPFKRVKDNSQKVGKYKFVVCTTNNWWNIIGSSCE